MLPNDLIIQKQNEAFCHKDHGLHEFLFRWYAIYTFPTPLFSGTIHTCAADMDRFEWQMRSYVFIHTYIEMNGVCFNSIPDHDSNLTPWL